MSVKVSYASDMTDARFSFLCLLFLFTTGAASELSDAILMLFLARAVVRVKNQCRNGGPQEYSETGTVQQKTSGEVQNVQ